MKGFFEHEYIKYKRSHLKNLIALAQADNQLHRTEIAFLYKIGVKYGLKKKQIAQMLEEKGNLALALPETYDARMDQLYDLVAMMLADGSVEIVELKFCDNMAMKMGFKSEIVHHLVDLVKSDRKETEEWEAFKRNAIEDMVQKDKP